MFPSQTRETPDDGPGFDLQQPRSRPGQNVFVRSQGPSTSSHRARKTASISPPADSPYRKLSASDALEGNLPAFVSMVTADVASVELVSAVRPVVLLRRCAPSSERAGIPAETSRLWRGGEQGSSPALAAARVASRADKGRLVHACASNAGVG